MEGNYLAFLRLLEEEKIGWFSWNRYWYLGHPTRFAFPPLFFLMLTFFAKALRVDVFYLYRLVTGFFYCLTPVTLYFFLSALTKKRNLAFISSLFYSLLPSIAYLFPSLSQEAGRFYYPPFRLLAFAYFGAGPGIVALAILPLALIFYLRFLRKFDRTNLFLAVISTAIVFLTEQATGVSLFLAGAAVFFSESFLGHGFAKWRKTLLVLGLTYGLIAFYFNLSYLTNLWASPALGGAAFKKIFGQFFQVFFIGVPVVLAFFSRKFVKEKQNQPVVIFQLWFLFFGFLTLIYFLQNPEFVAEYVRFIPELDMAVSFFLGLIVLKTFQKGKLKLRVFISGILVVLFGFFFVPKWQAMTTPLTDLAESREYRLASWLAKSASGKRVYTTGAASFWLNTFSDNPQVRGGSDQGAVHPFWHYASYQVREGDDPKVGLAWLKALNVSYIVVSGPESAEFYKEDYQFPRKFEGVLEPQYQKNGDTIYQVPMENPSLAQVVDQKLLKTLEVPESGKDWTRLRKYVDWIEKKQVLPASLSWKGPNEAEIKAKVGVGEGISIQVSFDPRWQATAQGQKVKIIKDPLGHMFLEPGKSGEYEIKLVYKESWDVYLWILLSIVTIVALIALSFWQKRAQDWSERGVVEEY